MGGARFEEKTAMRVLAATKAVERMAVNLDAAPGRVFETGAGKYLGKTTGSSTWTKGTKATVDLYWGGQPGAETKTGTLENVWNRFGDIPPGKWCWVEQTAHGWWYVTTAEC